MYFETGGQEFGGTLAITTGATIGLPGAIMNRSWKVRTLEFAVLPFSITEYLDNRTCSVIEVFDRSIIEVNSPR